MKDESVIGHVGRTGVPGEETATGAKPWPCAGLGSFRRQLVRMLGIWVPFLVLPFTHYVLVSRPHWGLAVSSS